MSFSIGDTVDAYRILEELGSGGMGRVFKVEHTLTHRLEALKVLEGGRPDALGQATRSLREIQVQAGLDHPNIAAVHNAFWLGEDLVLVMELIEGSSLRRMLEAGHVPLATAIDYACQALSALSYAHAHGVIHRDVSPSNMMVSSKGVLKLTDFGLSKGPADVQLSQPGVPIGSLYYMSPEQVRGVAAVGARSDIYSLGAVLYELVTGKRPFDCASAFALMMAHVEEAPIPPIELEPSLPPLLNQAILQSLAKDPSERFLTADDYRRTLMQVKPNRTQVKPSRLALPSIPAFPRSWLAGAAAAFAVLTVGVAGLVRSHGGHRIDQPPAAAVLNRPQVQAQKPPSPASPAPQPIPAQPPQGKDSPQRAVIKIAAAKRVAPKATTTSAIARESTLEPTPAISNTMIQPPEERPVPPAEPQPQPLVQPEEHAAIQPAEAPPQTPASPYTEATPKPSANGLKKGLGKIWQVMRHKKSSSEDSASPTETGRP
jgi:serine/threonine protein kinase